MRLRLGIAHDRHRTARVHIAHSIELLSAQRDVLALRDRNFSHHVEGAALLRGELFIRLREGLDRLGGRSAVPIVAAVYAVDIDRALRLQLEDVRFPAVKPADTRPDSAAFDGSTTIVSGFCAS